MTKTQTNPLGAIRGRVSAEEITQLEGTFYVYWGVPSMKEQHRVAVLHAMTETGRPVCSHVTEDAEVVQFPDGMREEIRWYKACRACASA